MLLLVDDAENLNVPLLRLLSREGYRIDTAPDVKAALAKLRGTVYDVVILGDDAVDAATAIRRAGWAVPIMVVAGDDAREAAALDAGATDYIVWPVKRPEVFLARLRALARLPGAVRAPSGTIRIDPENARVLLIDGRQVPITRTQRKLIGLFLDHPGRTLSHEYLIAKIWPRSGPVGAIQNLRQHLSLLNNKIDKRIKTVPGKGYRLDLLGVFLRRTGRRSRPALAS